MPRSTLPARSFTTARGAMALAGIALVFLGAMSLQMAEAFEAAEAGKPTLPKLSAAGEGDKNDSAGVDPAEETEALAFVREHHAELAKLLPQLKRSSPREYRDAVHDLWRTSRRLAARAERQPRHYELDLKAWKLQSRIDVLVARLSMSYSEELVVELRKLLIEEAKLRRARLLDEQQRAAARVEQLEETITNLAAGQYEQVEQEVARLLRQAGHRQTKQGGKATPSEARPANQAKSK